MLQKQNGQCSWLLTLGTGVVAVNVEDGYVDAAGNRGVGHASAPTHDTHPLVQRVRCTFLWLSTIALFWFWVCDQYYINRKCVSVLCVVSRSPGISQQENTWNPSQGSLHVGPWHDVHAYDYVRPIQIGWGLNPLHMVKSAPFLELRWVSAPFSLEMACGKHTSRST